MKLYCVDLWDIYLGGPRRQTADMHDKHFDEAHENLDKYEVTFIRKPSMEAIHDVPDKSLDFVYIDADHSFDFVMQDLIEWSKKVRMGGIVSGHDYCRFRGAGVVDAVDAYTRAHQVHEWFLTDERTPSYFWAKI